MARWRRCRPCCWDVAAIHGSVLSSWWPYIWSEWRGWRSWWCTVLLLGDWPQVIQCRCVKRESMSPCLFKIVFRAVTRSYALAKTFKSGFSNSFAETLPSERHTCLLAPLLLVWGPIIMIVHSVRSIFLSVALLLCSEFLQNLYWTCAPNVE